MATNSLPIVFRPIFSRLWRLAEIRLGIEIHEANSLSEASIGRIIRIRGCFHWLNVGEKAQNSRDGDALNLFAKRKMDLDTLSRTLILRD